MITEFRLGNFKAFAETQKIPIKPLTLIFGPNSAGKSSLIHGIALAHHAIKTGELDVYKTSIGGESIDLGGFRQYVHRRNRELTVEWGIELDVAKLTDVEENGRGRGLFSLRERIGFLGGTSGVVSKIGAGTTVWAKIPISQDTRYGENKSAGN